MNETSTKGVSLHKILSKALIKELEESIEKCLAAETHLATKVTLPEASFAHSISESFVSGGYSFGNVQIQIDLCLGNQLSSAHIDQPRSLQAGLAHNESFSTKLKIKHKPMKTRERFLVEVPQLILSPSTLTKLKELLGAECDCPDKLLRPVQNSVWDWCQQFGCINCGKRYICSCFKIAVKKHAIAAKQQKSIYESSGWPHLFLKKLSESEFRENSCHLCTGEPSNLFFCHPMYGSSVRVKYGAYMKKFEIDEGLCEKDAENKVRGILGIPKVGEGWVNETQLFRLISTMFSEYTVIREASPEWLGRQRLDIYIPALSLAIEYQGEQHYRPISLFGGEEGLKKTKERDRVKLTRCRQNGVKIVYFSYKENMSQPHVEKKLAKALSAAKRESGKSVKAL